LSQPIFSKLDKPENLVSNKLAIGIGFIIIASVFLYAGLEGVEFESFEIPEMDMDDDIKIEMEFEMDFGLIPTSPLDQPKTYENESWYSTLSVREKTLVDYAASNPDPNNWRYLGYDSETTSNIENLKNEIDANYTCTNILDSFIGNPGWSLRTYLAHKYINECI
jgi:hypothetical protein